MEVRILVSAVQLLVRAGRIIGEVGDRIWGLPISAEVWQLEPVELTFWKKQSYLSVNVMILLFHH